MQCNANYGFTVSLSKALKHTNYSIKSFIYKTTGNRMLQLFGSYFNGNSILNAAIKSAQKPSVR